MKPSDDLASTGSRYDGNLHSGHALTDEEHPVLDRHDSSPLTETGALVSAVYVLFFLDDLRDGINEKNGGARIDVVTISTFRGGSGRQRSLLVYVNNPYGYNHGASVRRFREEPTPMTQLVLHIRLVVSRNLP